MQVRPLLNVIVLFALAAFTLVRPCGAAYEDPPSLETIRTWVAQLGDEDFHVRERATQNLIKAQRLSVKLVAAAVLDGGPEVSARGFAILKQLAASPDEPTGTEVGIALDRLAKASDARVAGKAARLFGMLQQQRRARAIDMIRRLGGRVSVTLGKADGVTIDEDWAGGDQALRNLRLLPDVTRVNLEDSPITDAGMVHLAGLTKLTHLYLGHSQVKGPGLVHLKGLKKLSHLSLRYMPIEDKWLRHVGEMTHIHALGLDDTQVTDDSILLLARMSNLRTLWLDRSKVTGVGLARLKPLRKLATLDLDGVKLPAEDLASLAKLSLLTELYLQDTPTSDEGVAYLEKISTLRLVHLENTQVTEQGIAKLKKALPLVKVTH